MLGIELDIDDHIGERFENSAGVRCRGRSLAGKCRCLAGHVLIGEGQTFVIETHVHAPTEQTNRPRNLEHDFEVV